MTSKQESRERLDRRRVLETALDVIDREGLDALTMRRLAAELSVDPMTVHHHSRSKDGLLQGVAELLWEEIDRPTAGQHGIETLRTLAQSVRLLFHRHPEAAPLVLRCSTLPRSALELFRAYLDALDPEQLGGREPAAILRSVLSYALGYGHTESSMLEFQCGPIDGRNLSEREALLYFGQALPTDTPPSLAEAALAMVADCDSDQCFEDGLELMLAGLAVSKLEPRKA